jgi:hypothetical protein
MTPSLVPRRSVAAVCGFARACLAVAFSALAACEFNDGKPPAVTSQPIQQSTERGPVHLIVSVDREEISVGENLQLTLDAVAESGVALEMPRLESRIGVFEIIDSHTPPDIPDGAKRRWSHQYRVRTLEAGEQQIPSVIVKFTDRRGADDVALPQSELVSKPLTIHVRSMLTGDFDPADFRDIKTEVPVPLPWNSRPWLYGTAAVLLAAATIAAVMLAFKRRGRQSGIAAPPPPPHIWAQRQLDQLAAERLIERGEHHEYFFRLSAIARQYIEQRFGIMAAEQTTEEFLREAQRSASLSESHRCLLRDFLCQADMVKFARFHPPQHESEAALDAARHFVHDTAPTAAAAPPHDLAEVTT